MVSPLPFSPPQIMDLPTYLLLLTSDLSRTPRLFHLLTDFAIFFIFWNVVLIFPVHELAAAAGRPHRAAPEAPWAASGLRGAQAQARGARGAQALEGCTEGAAWSESLPTFWVAVYVFLLLMVACFLLSQLLGAKGKRFAKKRYAEKAQMKKT